MAKKAVKETPKATVKKEEPVAVSLTIEEVKPTAKSETPKVRAIAGFYDLEAGKSRIAGDEWEASVDRAESLRKLGLVIVL